MDAAINAGTATATATGARRPGNDQHRFNDNAANTNGTRNHGFKTLVYATNLFSPFSRRGLFGGQAI
jgi:argininosuccinate synthase